VATSIILSGDDVIAAGGAVSEKPLGIGSFSEEISALSVESDWWLGGVTMRRMSAARRYFLGVMALLASPDCHLSMNWLSRQMKAFLRLSPKNDSAAACGAAALFLTSARAVFSASSTFVG